MLQACSPPVVESQSPRRFAGVAKLYGNAGFAQIQKAHVCIVGVGGVGSWVVESLARSGVGTLTMIDLDHVAESNINRQLAALESTLGMAKVKALKARVCDINPDCEVRCVEDFVTLLNLDALVPADCDYLIDCIDHANTKAAMIAWCQQHELPVLTVGGTGGKTDPTRIKLIDLSRTERDQLLSKTRKALRQKHHFSRNAKTKFSVPAVVSDEQPVGLQATEQNSNRHEATASGLNCDGLGSITHVTASFAFVAVSRVLAHIVSSERVDA